MNNGMRPGIFHNPDPTYEKTAVKLHFESKRIHNDIERFLKKSDDAENISIRSISTACSMKWICFHSKAVDTTRSLSTAERLLIYRISSSLLNRKWRRQKNCG